MSAEQASGSALTRCLQEEAAAIAAAAERLDGAHVEAALALLEGCRARRAKLVVSGVGKSGIVARKIAANFSAIGLTAVYLSPVDALHGDLGIVAADDVVLLVSNSGETDELLAILPHLQRRGTARIALVGRVHSSLARGCDVVLDGSVDREICPLNLAPTASTAVTMAIGDALAAVWMERSGVSAADFAVNHPAGALGRKLTLCASDLMVPARDIEPLERHSALDDVIRVLTNAFPGTAWVTDAARRPQRHHHRRRPAARPQGPGLADVGGAAGRRRHDHRPDLHHRRRAGRGCPQDHGGQRQEVGVGAAGDRARRPGHAAPARHREPPRPAQGGPVMRRPTRDPGGAAA